MLNALCKNIKLTCYLTKLNSEMETKNPEKLIKGMRKLYLVKKLIQKRLR